MSLNYREDYGIIVSISLESATDKGYGMINFQSYYIIFDEPC